MAKSASDQSGKSSESVEMRLDEKKMPGSVR
jgi:hypothetical protein